MVSHIGENKESDLLAQIPDFEQKMRDVKEELSGKLSDYIYPLFSVGNDECRKILEIDSKEKRREKLDKFFDRVMSNALDLLRANIKDMVRKQNAALAKSLDDRLHEQRLLCASKKAQYDKLLALKNADVREQQIGKMQTIFTIDCCTAAIQELAGVENEKQTPVNN